MEQLILTKSEIVLYLTLINVLLGVLLGSFPLIVGLILKNRKFALYGFVVSIIGGAILGVLLSYPIAAVFTWLILKKSKTEAIIADDNSSPADEAASDALVSQVSDSSDSDRT